MLLAMIAILIPSCQEFIQKNDDLVTDQPSKLKSTASDWTEVYNTDPGWFYTTSDVNIVSCGDPYILPFGSSAMVSISNDDEYLYIKVTAEENWLINYLSLNVWDLNSASINNDYPSFPYQEHFDPMQSTVTYKLLRNAEWGDCMILNIKIRAQNTVDNSSRYWWVTLDNAYSSKYYLNYCWQECEECTPDGYRTQTQGGWGSKAAGNNPGAYRDANFDAAFPNGLTVGGYYTLHLSSSMAVQNFLPTGGKPAALTKDWNDPSGKKLKNTFAGQIVALTLSTEFDMYDPDFASAETHLANLVIVDGLGFDGMTVKDVLEEANKALGGESTDHSISQLNDILDLINNSFVDGNANEDLNIVKCPN